MITIPFVALLFLYFFFLIGFLVFSLINIGHLAATGTVTMASLTAATLFIIFSLVVIFFTWVNVAGVDWQAPLVVWSISWLSPIYSIGSVL